MILPFVREIFADVEMSPAFARAVTLVKGGAGQTRVSGLTFTGRALFYPLLQRATSRPLVIVVADNPTVEEMLPVVRSLGELTGAVAPDAVVGLPAYDVLPFENLSPHPEIQEARATALWKIATGAASIVITPLAATAMRLRSRTFYAELAKVVRCGEMVDPERLQMTVAQLEHALTARVRVEQAIGVLAERHRLRPRQAFELLRSAARARGKRVMEIATEVVESATNPLLRIPEELAKPPVTRRRSRVARRTLENG